MMNKKLLPFVGIALMSLCGCQQSSKTKKNDIVSQRYIHKYGYDVSKEEWKNNLYPGQVVTTLKNGVTVISSYEDGVLHGATSFTYAHSQTMESLQIFERGNLVKKTSFDIKGVPKKEEVFLSPGHVRTKLWYKTGTPMCLEETLDSKLIEGEYFTAENDVESKVEAGEGIKTIRLEDGSLLSRESFKDGICVAKETYFPSGSPETMTYFYKGQLHGEKKVFGASGDPIAVENYSYGKLHGLSTYFQNGYKYLESPYKLGKKEGIERQYIDGESIVEETEYHAGLKHGPSTFYSDGISKTEWYYNNDYVSRNKYEELSAREKMISIMNERSKPRYDEEDDSEFESIE